MRILISADMEGATGVTGTDDVVAGTEAWQRFRELFTGDVNACVAGLAAGGASTTLVNEAHSIQRHLLLERLDGRARMLTGHHKPLSMMEGIDSGVDGVVFLGYHTGAGAEGVLSHTYMESGLLGVWLDGTHASEGRLNATLAAEHGVPVLLVTGDDLTCSDARDYAPDSAVVAVKECVSRYAAICSPPERTATGIRAAAERAMRLAGRSSAGSSPHRVELEFTGTHLAAAAELVPTVERLGARTVGFEAADMTTTMKTFKVITTVASRAAQEVYG
ncbi:peptide ABC transporter substrate-binding protein [Actinopolyspora erythraea]|uniref:Peptide ABC transporter substrate-binding protein n=1 Tax=Actinopolyspora erythraea TaxID=414996 RepID=A0A099D3I6_9ACTN|nr:M55 family metallopeptidase [Actinopolyspora erythraea]ASU79272.1 peptide ABC transporter substrate-binding protein [Actinopolyspora erythraea]KGI80748.1 peptide ABC transporter substrate-binding protein [Actinopolyspora erythraea]